MAVSFAAMFACSAFLVALPLVTQWSLLFATSKGWGMGVLSGWIKGALQMALGGLHAAAGLGGGAGSSDKGAHSSSSSLAPSSRQQLSVDPMYLTRESPGLYDANFTGADIAALLGSYLLLLALVLLLVGVEAVTATWTRLYLRARRAALLWLARTNVHWSGAASASASASASAASRARSRLPAPLTLLHRPFSCERACCPRLTRQAIREAWPEEFVEGCWPVGRALLGGNLSSRHKHALRVSASFLASTATMVLLLPLLAGLLLDLASTPMTRLTLPHRAALLLHTPLTYALGLWGAGFALIRCVRAGIQAMRDRFSWALVGAWSINTGSAALREEYGDLLAGLLGAKGEAGGGKSRGVVPGGRLGLQPSCCHPRQHRRYVPHARQMVWYCALFSAVAGCAVFVPAWALFGGGGCGDDWGARAAGPAERSCAWGRGRQGRGRLCQGHHHCAQRPVHCHCPAGQPHRQQWGGECKQQRKQQQQQQLGWGGGGGGMEPWP